MPAVSGMEKNSFQTSLIFCGLVFLAASSRFFVALDKISKKMYNCELENKAELNCSILLAI